MADPLFNMMISSEGLIGNLRCLTIYKYKLENLHIKQCREFDMQRFNEPTLHGNSGHLTILRTGFTPLFLEDY